MLTKTEEDRIFTRVMERLARLLHESVTGVAQDEPEYLSPADVHQRFSIEPATVRGWVRRGDVEGVEGRPFLVKTASLRRYLNAK